MPAGPVGACWLEDAWLDTAWEADAWSDAEVVPLPETMAFSSVSGRAPSVTSLSAAPSLTAQRLAPGFTSATHTVPMFSHVEGP